MSKKLSLRDQIDRLKKRSNDMNPKKINVRNDGNNIKVCVRVRPMTDNETTESTELLDVENDSILFKEDEKEKQFTYDHCFAPSSTQLEIYNTLCSDIIGKSIEGMNQCVFAYGMTSSGKTHTMFGAKSKIKNTRVLSPDVGIIPRLCNDLFDQIGKSAYMQIEVDITYIEIYCEQIYDLLNDKDIRGSVHIHPKMGVYVKGAEKFTVSSIEEILNYIQEGNDRRKVASTKMNNRSSRSHAVFTIYIKQHTISHVRHSKIHLVDLAGSEPLKKSMVTGVHMKEAININKSLSTLGLVINKLSAVSCKHKKNKHDNSNYIPFRDSVLTLILKDALGGNSETIMIATVSPAAVHRTETLSTLRYASTAKTIKNSIHINSIRQEENKKIIESLKEQLSSVHEFRRSETQRNISEIENIKSSLLEKMKQMKEENDIKYKQLEEELEESNEELTEINKEYKELSELHKLLKSEIDEYKLKNKDIKNMYDLKIEKIEQECIEKIDQNNMENIGKISKNEEKVREELGEIIVLHKKREENLMEQLDYERNKADTVNVENNILREENSKKDEELDTTRDELDLAKDEIADINYKLRDIENICNEYKRRLDEVDSKGWSQTVEIARTRRKSAVLAMELNSLKGLNNNTYEPNNNIDDEHSVFIQDEEQDDDIINDIKNALNDDDDTDINTDKTITNEVKKAMNVIVDSVDSENKTLSPNSIKLTKEIKRKSSVIFALKLAQVKTRMDNDDQIVKMNNDLIRLKTKLDDAEEKSKKEFDRNRMENHKLRETAKKAEIERENIKKQHAIIEIEKKREEELRKQEEQKRMYVEQKIANLIAASEMRMDNIKTIVDKKQKDDSIFTGEIVVYEMKDITKPSTHHFQYKRQYKGSDVGTIMIKNESGLVIDTFRCGNKFINTDYRNTTVNCNFIKSMKKYKIDFIVEKKFYKFTLGGNFFIKVKRTLPECFIIETNFVMI